MNNNLSPEQPQNLNRWLPAGENALQTSLNTEQIIEWFQGRAFTEVNEREAILQITIDGIELQPAIERILREFRNNPNIPGQIPSPLTIIHRLNEFPNLQGLVIIRTELSLVPHSIENLQNLQILDLAENRINSISNRIGNLLNLQGLYFQNNRIETLPETIGNLTSLTDLDISDNRIEFLPQSIIRLNALVRFSYFDNPFYDQEETENNTEELLWDRQPEGVRDFLERFQDQQGVYLEGDFENVPGLENERRNENNYESTLNLNRNIIEFVNEAPHQEVGGIAFQVHNFYSKININQLLEFLKENTNTNINAEIAEIKTMKDIIKYIDSTFITIIGIMNSNKETTLKEFKKVFKTHLIRKEYNTKDVKVIVACLEYVKKQPKEFQEAYVSSYAYDCTHAYNDSSPMSCSKGTFERIVTSLVNAAVVIESTNKNTFERNKYAELISIIQNIPLSNAEKIRKDIDRYAQECSGNNSINSNEKLIECIKQKFEERLTNSISSEIETYIPTLSLYGGKRRHFKTRKAIKNKKLRKTLSKYKKSLRRVLKHKTRRHMKC